MYPADNLAQLQQAARTAQLHHAARPFVQGPFAEAYSLWRKLYEAKAALNDQNPGFALTLLPVNPPIAGKVPGFPMLPAGVRWALDEASPGTLTVSIDVTGTVVLQVTTPGSTIPILPLVTAGATRQSATFAAGADGLYTVAILVGNVVLNTIYVPVQRAQFLDFREKSRRLSFAFDANANPVANETYSEMLAVLYACDAAAATGQTTLFTQLAAIADSIEKAPTPIALFPGA